jgi:LemA protein
VTSRPKWLIPVAVVVGVLLVIVLPLVSSRNRFVDKETAVDQAFGDLDAEYQRRADLIPNLSNAVKAALNQEQAVFGQIARARANYAGASSDSSRLDAANQLEGGLERLLVVVENYPQLQSNQNIRDLQIQLESTENRVGQGRRTYNASVTDYNRSIRRFPGSIAAGLFGFDKRPLFRAQAADRDAPTVDLNPATTTTAAPATTTTTR